jgi:hypothetical protein
MASADEHTYWNLADLLITWVNEATDRAFPREPLIPDLPRTAPPEDDVRWAFEAAGFAEMAFGDLASIPTADGAPERDVLELAVTGALYWAMTGMIIGVLRETRGDDFAQGFATWLRTVGHVPFIFKAAGGDASDVQDGDADDATP